MRIVTVVACATMLSCRAVQAQSADPLTPTGRWTAYAGGRAATPPMGWNSWNAFASAVDEDKVMGSAQRIVDSGLARKGYRYINLDDGWAAKRRMPDGHLIIRADKFPSTATRDKETPSFKPYTDKLHAMGLKAGIYSDMGRNTCPKAASRSARSGSTIISSRISRSISANGASTTSRSTAVACAISARIRRR